MIAPVKSLLCADSLPFVQVLPYIVHAVLCGLGNSCVRRSLGQLLLCIRFLYILINLQGTQYKSLSID